MSTLLEKLKRYSGSGALPMHMPGHKRNTERFPWLSELGCGLDITEIDGFDNLNDPQGLFLRLEERAAELWGAERTFCMVNGSTGGILAAVRAALSHGGELLMARGCHRSVYNAAELVGAKVHYLVPPVDGELGIWGSVPPELVEEKLRLHRDVGLVVVTSPTYEGVISDISSIARVCHRHGVPLLVDEAHGAHLGFGDFPRSAVSCGADMVVQSLHKTLPSLTQTALFHVSGDLVDGSEAARNAGIFQSSSPSYLLSASIEGCVGFLEERGDIEAERWQKALETQNLTAGELKRLGILCRGGESPESRGFFAFDPSKLVIYAKGKAPSGAELMRLLREKCGVELEMAAGEYCLAMTGMGDDDKTVSRLGEALRTIDRLLPETAKREAAGEPVHIPERIMPAGDAMRAKKAEAPLKAAAGRVSAEYVWVYPPGSPVLVPGELVDERTISDIEAMSSRGLDVRSTYGNLPGGLFCVEKAY
ncbi:MAG: aminotransferase class I/II-fold pyridoxal phosphate-dependent enzyme [Oscillospiraceae bacterium]